MRATIKMYNVRNNRIRDDGTTKRVKITGSTGDALGRPAPPSESRNNSAVLFAARVGRDPDRGEFPERFGFNKGAFRQCE